MEPTRGRRRPPGVRRFRWAKRSSPASRPPTSAPCAFGIFKRGSGARRQVDRHRGRAPDRRADGGAAVARAARARDLRRDDPDAYRALGFPGRRRPREHVPVQARVRAQLLRIAQRRLRARAPSGAHGLRGVARAQRRRACRSSAWPWREAALRSSQSPPGCSPSALAAQPLPERLSETGLDATRRQAFCAAVPVVVGRCHQAAVDHCCRPAPRSTPQTSTHGSFRRARSCGRSSRFDRPVETRLIERLADGSWRFATYVWNAAGTDADARAGGRHARAARRFGAGRPLRRAIARRLPRVPRRRAGAGPRLLRRAARAEIARRAIARGM